MKPLIKIALQNAAATALYVVLIGSFLFYTPKIFGQADHGPVSVLVPIVMLMLLVFSAALCGALIFGRPVFWYLDGKKKDALSLLTATLGIFFVITLGAAFCLYLGR